MKNGKFEKLTELPIVTEIPNVKIPKIQESSIYQETESFNRLHSLQKYKIKFLLAFCLGIFFGFFFFKITSDGGNTSDDSNSILNCPSFDYDYYMLALQYTQGNICRTNNFNCSTKKYLNEILWTIHGLWPSKYEGTKFDCEKIELNLDYFSIRERLAIYWPSLKNGVADYKFQNHEWLKHGTCMNFCKYGIENSSSVSQYIKHFFYLTKTLDLRDKYNPKYYLENNAIYTLNDLQNIFAGLNNNLTNIGNVQIMCEKRLDGRQGIAEVRIPLDLKNFEPFSSDFIKFKSNCNNDPIYMGLG